MKVLDFATSDGITAQKIINAFGRLRHWSFGNLDQALRHPSLRKWWMPTSVEKLPNGDLRMPLTTNVLLQAWIQGEYMILSFDLSVKDDPSWHALLGLTGVMKLIGRRDLPVKVDKMRTISLKAAVVIAAMDVAQGKEDCSGILWDMQEEGLI